MSKTAFINRTNQDAIRAVLLSDNPSQASLGVYQGLLLGMHHHAVKAIKKAPNKKDRMVTADTLQDQLMDNSAVFDAHIAPHLKNPYKYQHQKLHTIDAEVVYVRMYRLLDKYLTVKDAIRSYMAAPHIAIMRGLGEQLTPAGLARAQAAAQISTAANASVLSHEELLKLANIALFLDEDEGFEYDYQVLVAAYQFNPGSANDAAAFKNYLTDIYQNEKGKEALLRLSQTLAQMSMYINKILPTLPLGSLEQKNCRYMSAVLNNPKLGLLDKLSHLKSHYRSQEKFYNQHENRFVGAIKGFFRMLFGSRKQYNALSQLKNMVLQAASPAKDEQVESAKSCSPTPC